MAFQSGKQSFPVLKSINWEIPKGNIQLLMGPSGSGKTTLAGLLTPAAGNIYLLDQEITIMSRSKRTQFRQRNIGFIFQNFNLFPALTVAENVEVVLNLKGIVPKKRYLRPGVVRASGVGFACPSKTARFVWWTETASSDHSCPSK